MEAFIYITYTIYVILMSILAAWMWRKAKGSVETEFAAFVASLIILTSFAFVAMLLTEWQILNV